MSGQGKNRAKQFCPVNALPKKRKVSSRLGMKKDRNQTQPQSCFAKRKEYDVIIIGAGIAGSVAARLLASKKRTVLLVEKDDYSGQTVACGGLFDRPYFRRYVNDPTVLEQPIRKNIFHLPWGKVVYDCDQVTVKRRVFDRYLAGQAERAGAELHNGVKALDFKIEKPGRAQVQLRRRRDGMVCTVNARLILFADGPRSLAFKNPTFARQLDKRFWSYAYAYEVQGTPLPQDEAHIYFAPQLFSWGYGWIFPNKKESNVGLGTILPEMKRISLKEKLLTFLQEFAPTAPLLKNRSVVDKKGGYLPMRLMHPLSDHSQLLLGDAGGMVSPLFGAGIDYAIEAAEAAAQTAEEALRTNRFDARFLRTYDHAVDERFGKDLRKQLLLARWIIFSKKFGRLWPIKWMSVVAFGNKYSRWNKIKILLFPLLGKPRVKAENDSSLEHK